MRLWEAVQASTEDALKKFRTHGRVDFELPTALFKTTDGWLPERDRWADRGQFVTGATTIFDVKTPVMTTQNAIEYMALVESSDLGIGPEGGTRAIEEMSLTYEPRTADIPAVKGVLPITEEAYADDSLMVDTINSQLLHLARRRSSRLIVSRITSRSDARVMRSSPRSAENPEPLYPATDILQAWGEISREEATAGFVMMYGPTWNRILLESHENNDPNVTGYTFYNRPVLEESQDAGMIDSAKSGTWAVTGALDSFDIAMRRDAYIEIGHDGDDFSKNQMTMRVVMRAGLVLYRPLQMIQILTAA